MTSITLLCYENVFEDKHIQMFSFICAQNFLVMHIKFVLLLPTLGGGSYFFQITKQIDKTGFFAEAHY